MYIPVVQAQRKCPGGKFPAVDDDPMRGPSGRVIQRARYLPTHLHKVSIKGCTAQVLCNTPGTYIRM